MPEILNKTRENNVVISAHVGGDHLNRVFVIVPQVCTWRGPHNLCELAAEKFGWNKKFWPCFFYGDEGVDIDPAKIGWKGTRLAEIDWHTGELTGVVHHQNKGEAWEPKK